MMPIPDNMPPIADLLLHEGRMLLLDRLLACDDEFSAAEVTVPASGLFMQSAGMPAWVGLEYMAQTVGAWAGYHGRKRGIPPQMGFLLGTRDYKCSMPYFPVHAELRIEAQGEFLSDKGLSMFSCKIFHAGAEIAAAKISVFEPDDPQAILQGTGI